MSNDFVANEVSKIISDKEFTYPKNLSMACSWIIAHYKGINIKIIDVSNSSSLADHYVLASCTNTTQARSMSEEIIHQMKENGVQKVHVEGGHDSDWILIDGGDFIVHLFQDYARDIFDLDGLWHEHPIIEIPNEYYHGPSATSSDEGGDENYF